MRGRTLLVLLVGVVLAAIMPTSSQAACTPPYCPSRPPVVVHIHPRMDGTARARIRVRGPGRVRIAGKSIRTVHRNAGRRRRFVVTLRLKGRAKRQLSQRGWTRQKVIVTYRPSSGATILVRRRVRFHIKRSSR